MIQNPIHVVFHKEKAGYELQNEVRFVIICPEKPEHYELKLFNDDSLMFERIPLKKGFSIRIILKKLEFDEGGNPIRFSSDVKLYEGLSK